MRKLIISISVVLILLGVFRYASSTVYQRTDAAYKASSGGYVLVSSRAQVWVYVAGTSNLATLYLNSAGTTTTTNPVVADANGNFTYYATAGFYDEIVVGPIGTAPVSRFSVPVGITLGAAGIRQVGQVFYSSSYSDFNTLVTAAASTANGVVIIDAPVPLTSNVTTTVPITYGGGIISCGTFTASIRNFQGGPARAFDSTCSAGDIVFGPETGIIYSEWFGAKADGTTDSTNGIYSAILSVPTNGGVIQLVSGTYNVTSINLSSSSSIFSKTTVLRGMGAGAGTASGATTIAGTLNGAIVIDAIGTNNLVLENFTITTSGATIAQTGLLLARSTISQNCSRSRIRNVNIEGSFSLAAHIAIAAESSIYDGCRFSNSNAAANYTTFWTGIGNIIGVVSTHGTVFTSSNTDNRMYSCEFYAPYDNANVIVLYGGAGYAFYSPLVITGNAVNGRLVTLQTQTTTGIFGGQPVAFYSPLFEGNNPVAFYFSSDTAGVNYYNNITSENGYYNIYSAGTYSVVGYSGTVIPILNNWRFNGPRFNDTTPPLFRVFGVVFSSIDLYNTTLAGTITLDNFQQSSVLRANVVNEGSTNVAMAGVYYGTAAPVTGTYSRGARVVNLAPADGQPTGWICTVSGSPGIWSPETPLQFNRTLSSGLFLDTGANTVILGTGQTTTYTAGQTTIGYAAGAALDTGGNFNTLIGLQTGATLTVGSRNVMIGAQTGLFTSPSTSNKLLIDNQARSDNDALINGTFSATTTSQTLSFNAVVSAIGGTANGAVCWKADSKTLGYCSSAVGVGGTCTCN